MRPHKEHLCPPTFSVFFIQPGGLVDGGNGARFTRWPASHLFFLLLSVLFSVVTSTYLWAQQPGELDSTFGTEGRVFTEVAVSSHNYFYPTTESMLVQLDGKILVSGRFWEDSVSYWYGTFMVRYLPNGTLDSSFGDNGRVALIAPAYPYGNQAVGADMALQPDGKIVLIGQGTIAETIMVQRYTASGQLDATFGDNGTTFVHGNAFEEGTSIAIQQDGKIVGAGWDYNPYVNPYYDANLVFRLHSNGSPDTSFGLAETGKVFIGDGYDGAEVLVQPDARILVVGALNNFADVPPTILLARYRVDGSPDASFGTDGMLTHRVNNRDSVAHAAALQTDGKIVVAASVYPSSLTAIRQSGGTIKAAGTADPLTAVVRYSPDGSLDASFGTGGVVTLDWNFLAHANAVLLQSNGKIVVTGGDDFTVVRFNSDGSLDTGFGDDGRSVFPIDTGGGNSADALVGALQPDGKILVTGSFGNYYTDSHEKIALIRVNGDPGPANPINAGLNDAWVGTAPGQGFFFTVLPQTQRMFAALFTFEAAGGPISADAIIGSGEHRWLTASGPYSGNTATLTIELTTGGAFDEQQAVQQDSAYGSLDLTFEADCMHATAHIVIPSAAIDRVMPLQRASSQNVQACLDQAVRATSR